jgi:hypothetical protein
MPHPKTILVLLLLTILSFQYSKAHNKRFQFGMEPFYNYGIYSRDEFSNPSERINIVGLGFYSEYQLSQKKEKWIIKSGLYYLQFYSKSNLTYAERSQFAQDVLGYAVYYLTSNIKYISHSIRIPVILKYQIERFIIIGGFLFDFELTNQEKSEAKLTPTVVCIDYPELERLAAGISWEQKRNNSLLCIGPEVGIGYNLNYSKVSIAPIIKYNFQVGFEYPITSSEKYSRSFHALGIKCFTIKKRHNSRLFLSRFISLRLACVA